MVALEVIRVKMLQTKVGLAFKHLTCFIILTRFTNIFEEAKNVYSMIMQAKQIGKRSP